VAALDRMVKAQRPNDDEDDFSLPHWNVLPSTDKVSGAELLNDLRVVFRKYIYAPSSVADAAALWVLHAWTIDAGDISPFFVLVSPTKRCGKTSMLILLMYLTPRSELASNISSSALFRYVEHIKPTLLIDEADSFVSASDELRGILNSGHTRVAANIIRNVEINGEHLPRRFSTWCPKAIATIRDLADTLEDRSIMIPLQRKPKAAEVARLRKRDCLEFSTLRQRAARWAQDSFNVLAADPDPDMPDELNDRAADNWRPLIAIADLAGADWPRRARDAARALSGVGHEAKSINVELLADIKLAFGEAESMWSIDLVAALNADQERPWATWNKGKPISQKQLANLLKPFEVISEAIWINGSSAKGYKRVRFEDVWASYLGQNTLRRPISASEASKRQSAEGTGTSDIFPSVREAPADGSKNSNLSNSHAGSDALTDQNVKMGGANGYDQTKAGLNGGSHPEVEGAFDDGNSQTPDELFPDLPAGLDRRGEICAECGQPWGGQPWDYNGVKVRLHPHCEEAWIDAHEASRPLHG
jgi:putative DNA primase/helicase